MGRCVAHYRPPGMIEIDVALGRCKPRLQTVIHYLFHELGHHKSFLEKPKEMTEKDAEAFARIMMKRWRESKASFATK